MTPTGFEPAIVKLKSLEKDKVRIIAAKREALTVKPRSAFGGPVTDPFARDVLSIEVDIIPTDTQISPDGVRTIRPTRELEPGEYALVLQKSEPKSLKLSDTVADFRVTK